MIDTNNQARWYVVHTYSGYENKVKDNLEKIIENRNLADRIMDVRIPVETVLTYDGDKTKETEHRLFPCYVLVKMLMSDETWHIVRNVSGVTGFVGPGSKPTPLSDEEVAALGVDVRVEVSFAVGDTVKIIAGPVMGFTGRVDEISPDTKKVRVIASIFGRDTPVELDITDVVLEKN